MKKKDWELFHLAKRIGDFRLRTDYWIRATTWLGKEGDKGRVLMIRFFDPSVAQGNSPDPIKIFILHKGKGGSPKWKGRNSLTEKVREYTIEEIEDELFVYRLSGVEISDLIPKSITDLSTDGIVDAHWEYMKKFWCVSGVMHYSEKHTICGNLEYTKDEASALALLEKMKLDWRFSNLKVVSMREMMDVPQED